MRELGLSLTQAGPNSPDDSDTEPQEEETDDAPSKTEE